MWDACGSVLMEMCPAAMLLSSSLLSSQAKERRKRWLVEGEVGLSNRVVGGCNMRGGVKCQLQWWEGREKCEVVSVRVCDEWEEGSEA